jgi:hypothetical protein
VAIPQWGNSHLAGSIRIRLVTPVIEHTVQPDYSDTFRKTLEQMFGCPSTDVKVNPQLLEGQFRGNELQQGFGSDGQVDVQGGQGSDLLNKSDHGVMRRISVGKDKNEDGSSLA